MATNQVAKVVGAITGAAKTGQIGDGKIFVVSLGSRGAHPHRRDRRRGALAARTAGITDRRVSLIEAARAARFPMVNGVLTSPSLLCFTVVPRAFLSPLVYPHAHDDRPARAFLYHCCGGRQPLAVRAADRADRRHRAGQAGHQFVGRRAATSDPVVCRPGARRAPRTNSAAIRPTRASSRSAARSPPGSAAATSWRARSMPKPKCWCSTARARACSSPPSPPSRWVARRAGKPAMLIPNPFYAAYSAGALAADCEPVYLPATRASALPARSRCARRCAAGAHGRVLHRLAVEPAGRGRRSRLS